MALGGVTITWDENDPADADLVGLGAGDIRSTKTNVRGALDSEHHFPAAGGTAGAHRKGSAMAFHGAASAVSSSDTEGRIMITSDTSRLYHVASAVTMFMGGRAVPEAALVLNDRLTPSTYTSTVTQAWALECGAGQIPVGSGNTAITLQHTYVRAIAQFAPVGSSTLGWATFRAQALAATASGSFTGATLTAYAVNNSTGANEALTSGNTLDFTYMVMGFRSL